MNDFVQMSKRIESWLKDQGVENYTINSDLTIDVAGDVRLNNRGLKSLPYQFGSVGGKFSCSQNELTSLKNCPHTVGGFYCFGNFLTTLEYAPKRVEDDFSCSQNSLTSLVGAPETINEMFDCGQNCLTTLLGAPKTVQGRFQCHNNRLTSLEHGPEHVGEDYYCCHNYLENLEFCPKYVGLDFYCHHNAGLGDTQDIYDFKTILELHLQYLKAKAEKNLLLSTTPAKSLDLLLSAKKHKI